MDAAPTTARRRSSSSKPFETVEQVAGILREASAVTTDRCAVRTPPESAGCCRRSTAVDGDIDLKNVTTGVPTDPELLDNLAAQSVDPAVIDLQLLAQVKSSFGLKIVVRPAWREGADGGGQARRGHADRR